MSCPKPYRDAISRRSAHQFENGLSAPALLLAGRQNMFRLGDDMIKVGPESREKDVSKPVERSLRSFKSLTLRNVIFLAFSLGIVFLCWEPLIKLVSLSRKSELYSHIVLIPFISAYFMWARRERIFQEPAYSITYGLPLIVGGLLLYGVGLAQGGRLNENDSMTVLVFSGVTCWAGGFLLFYGPRAFRNGLFPLVFLVFLAPVPTRLIEGFIFSLQVASAEVTAFFFWLTGVPVAREGFVFHLPGLSIEVAKQCSGIRSSIALVITSLIAGEFFLRSGWRRLLFTLSIFPVTVVKNGLRIVTLSLLGTYVDPRILGSELHKSGGIPFFGIALLMLAPVLWLLRRGENKNDKR